LSVAAEIRFLIVLAKLERMTGSRQLQPQDFGLTDDQFNDIKNAFDEFDRDASGACARLMHSLLILEWTV